MIMSPWNYPFQLVVNPLIGAISAGCCAVVKPSPYTPNVALFLENMIRACFEEQYIGVVQGEIETNKHLFAQRFDQIFFTGSPHMGKVVMRAAAEFLTPVILELGGKSPCVVDQTAHIPTAAKRIAWGKTLNAGQTCIAPDYLYLHESVKTTFIHEYRTALVQFFGENPKESPHYARIVHDAAMQRLLPYLSEGTCEIGGENDPIDRYIAPTLLTGITENAAIMQSEIFGPILPVIGFEDLSVVLKSINEGEHPLAAYYFGDKRTANRFKKEVIAGGIGINDVLLHVANHHLPFGGVGTSGMGTYHGRLSFEAFTHRKAVFTSRKKLDIPVKYAPYPFFKWIKRFI
jgi:aldehyde dehydrogenase (NAD+)